MLVDRWQGIWCTKFVPANCREGIGGLGQRFPKPREALFTEFYFVKLAEDIFPSAEFILASYRQAVRAFAPFA